MALTEQRPRSSSRHIHTLLGILECDIVGNVRTRSPKLESEAEIAASVVVSDERVNQARKGLPWKCAPDESDDKDSGRSEEHTSELQSPCNLVCRLLLEKKR